MSEEIPQKKTQEKYAPKYKFILFSAIGRLLYRNIATFVLITALILSLISSLVVIVFTGVAIDETIRHISQEELDPSNLPKGFILKHIVPVAAVALIVPVVGTLLLSFAVKKKVVDTIKGIRKDIANLRKVDQGADLSALEQTIAFSELREVIEDMAQVVCRVNELTLSKRILEMELLLTRSLIIPSEMGRSWQDTVKSILGKVSEVVDFLAFYIAILSVEDEADVHIFWRYEPREDLEALIVNEVENATETRTVLYTFTLDRKGYEGGSAKLVSKTLREPTIGDVVSVGFLLREEVDATTVSVVESFLNAFLSLAGSLLVIDKYMRNLEYYATRDFLTNLYNQRVFWEFLEYEVERAKRREYSFAVMLMDIDNFKVINDTYGHDFGDKFLSELARILRDSFRREDVVARYGGDEFAVILPYTDTKKAVSVAQRLLRRLEEFSVPAPDGKPIKVSVSIGIAVFPDHARTARELFIVADNMMYKAKEEGKNRVKIPSEEELKEETIKVGKIGMILIDALENKKIEPFFQPIVSTSTLEVFAHEILMRVEQEGKILQAGNFIHIAEDMGIVHKLDYILFEKTLQKVKETGFRGKLFFNLSPKALVTKDFVFVIRDILKDYNFPPERIVFELTERETVRNIDILKNFVESLRAEGILFAIDDFGSGYSSFIYLKHLPVNFLKIEGEFVKNITTSRVDLAFVNSMVAMAKSLNIRTIAEFVENEEIFNKLKDLGVDYVQGYYVGRPDRVPINTVKAKGASV